nr:hypothetical protein [Deltaproteobacteria bacterium]
MNATELSPWSTINNPPGARIRVPMTGEPEHWTLMIANLGGRWKVLLPPGQDDPIYSKFAAPNEEIVRAYANDYLFRKGFS